MKLHRVYLPLLFVAAVALAWSRPTQAHKVFTADGKVVPHWVRYPFEFQLCGIALGTRGVDRDPVNKIDRYSLFFVHGNPTAVVAPGLGTVGSAQAPPGSGAPFLENTPNAPWMQAVNIGIPGGYVMWLYRREGYAMGYVVDPLGFVTAITVAGDNCPIAATQMGDPYHAVRLGDDFRKVLWRYGYPDLLTLFGETSPGDAGGGGEGGASGDGGGGVGPGGGRGGRGGGGAGAVSSLPPTRAFARRAGGNVTTLVRQLEAMTRVETRHSARMSGRNLYASLPPLPPARLEMRRSGLGAMGGGAMGAPAPPGFGGGAGASGLGPGAGGGAAGGGLGDGDAGGFGDAGGAGGAGGGFGNAPFMTYQLDYRDTYNVMFTIQNNRVVRIFIWGDPDYFTDRQRLQMRTRF